jgi:hypothetical protein
MNCAYGNTRLARSLVRFALIISGVVLLAASCALCTQTTSLLWLLLLVLAADSGVAVYAVKQGLLFEWSLERTWKAVCGGIAGGKFKGEARSYRFGLIGAYVLGDTKTIYPKLREVHGTHEAWTGIVTPFAGQTIEEYNEHTKAFALAFNVRFVSFERTDTGLVQIRCGPVQVPEMYEYPVEQLAKLADSATVLRAVPMARTIDGRPWYL